MNYLKITQSVCAAALLAGLSLSATATQTPVFTTFGGLPVATFGGSGIPNGAVAITTFGQGGILGLTATQRFAMPVVTNDGAGRFSATGGAFPANAQNLGKWNFDYYIDNAGQTGITYQLFMDVDPSAGENFKSFGPSVVSGVAQDSWNLGFDGFETVLSYSFDPNATGEYSFRLVASNVDGIIATSAIVVQIPEPGSLALMGLALAGLVALRRKQKA
jgi:hypothetical protein